MRRETPAAIFLLLFILPCTLGAVPPERIQSLEAKLDAWKVEEAWGETQALLRAEPKDAKLLELASQIAYHRGEYAEALRLARSAIAQGAGDEGTKTFALFVEQTMAVVTPFKKYESAHFIIHLDEKQDGILVDYITGALERTYATMARQYGFQPREKIRVEIFPDTRAFYYASTLSARDIEVMGALGLTQFHKLMLLSPRAMVYGYRWLDALSHEYMHYLIMKLTNNKAPIWFHEGLAKYEETRWRSGPSYLSPLYRTLLARALAEEKLVAFERMEPSLVSLNTAEEAQLAYAQAAAAVEFIIVRSGYPGLKEVMAHMAASADRGAGAAIQAVLGMSFKEFEGRWKEFLKSKDLKEVGGVRVPRRKIKEGKVTEEAMDMEEIKSLVARNRAHLGDRLKERGRRGAAVLEYRRALAEAPDSVALMNRLAALLIDLGRDEEALESLRRAMELAPDHPIAYHHLGKIYLTRHNFQAAQEALLTAIEINPFDPAAHQDLAGAYEGLGKKTAAAREREIAQKLRP